MRAHTEVNDTVWSFVKVFLQILVQKKKSSTNFGLINLENMSCAELQICVVSFPYAYISQAIFKHKSLLKF